jgi:type VI secretion system secreted protein VgrG
VQDVLRRAGLYVGRLDLRLQGNYLTREYCVQHRERDFDFVARLLAEEGVAFHFEHDEDGERLVLSDHASAWQPIVTFDGARVPIAGAESQTLHTEPVRFFERARSLEPSGATVRDFDFTRPRFDVKGADPRAQGVRPTYEFHAPVVLAGYSGNAYAQDNAEAQATKRAMLYAHRDQRAQGAGAVTTFTPGSTFELTGHNVASFDGRYVVVRVTHEGVAPEELTERTQHDNTRADRYRNTFECAPAERMVLPERTVARPTISGVQTATVVGPAGEEIYTDVHGRIKVQFHWDREGHRDERSSCWIRSMQPWGGPGWGFVFVPRIGMEVVVSFVEGDPDRPLVIGSVYNGENGTPYPQPDQKTRSTLKTNSTPGGGGYNELRFEDAAGNEEIYLQAQKDFNELVKHNHSTTVRNNQTNAVTCNQTETVGGNQSMTVTGDRTKTIHGNETVVVDKNRTETVHQNEVHTIDINRTHTVHGAASLTVDRTRTLTVTGKNTETFDGERHSTVKTLDKLTVNGKREVTVHGEYNTIADTQFHVTQKADHLFIKDSVDLKSAGKLTFHNGKTKVEMSDGGVVTLSADNEIKLVCGSSSISLKKDGTITINGAKEVAAGSGPSSVRVEPAGVNSAGPKINAAAIGVHEISGALIKIN